MKFQVHCHHRILEASRTAYEKARNVRDHPTARLYFRAYFAGVLWSLTTHYLLAADEFPRRLSGHAAKRA